MSKLLKGEAAVKRAICDLLDAYHIMYFRMNAGNRYGVTNGKSWCIQGHEAGTADILAAPHVRITTASGFTISVPWFVWIEAKRPEGGKHSEAQKQFQWSVELQGHKYILATSSDDVLAKLKELGAV